MIRVIISILVVALSLTAGGCGLIQATADLPGNAVRAMNPGKETAKPADPVVLQQDLFRVADEVSTKLDQVLMASADDPKVAQSAADLLVLRLGMRNRMVEIVTGPNAFIGLVDMVFTVTLLENAVATHFAPEDGNAPDHPMIEVLADARQQVKDLAISYLGPDQVDRLVEIIDPWLEKDLLPVEALFTRYQGLTQELLGSQPKEQGNQPTSLFGALMLDPLAGLDPTVREIAQTRLLAERALYIGQRSPSLLRLQTELLAIRLMEQPVVNRMVEVSESSAESVERITTVTESLPDRISAERKEILQALEEQSSDLTAMMAEVKAAIGHGEGALVQANTLVPAVDHLLEQLGAYEPADPDAPPFEISEYTEVLRELQTVLAETNQVTANIQATLDAATHEESLRRMEAVTESTLARGGAWVDSILLRGLLFIAASSVVIGGVVILVRRLSPRSSSS